MTIAERDMYNDIRIMSQNSNDIASALTEIAKALAVHNEQMAEQNRLLKELLEKGAE